MDIEQIEVKLAALEIEKQPYKDAIEAIEVRARVLRDAKMCLITKGYGLANGDKLVVNSECWLHLSKRGWPEWQLDGWREGDVLVFKSLLTRNLRHTCTLMSGSTGSGAFPIEMVQKMRAAYINITSEEVE